MGNQKSLNSFSFFPEEIKNDLNDTPVAFKEITRWLMTDKKRWQINDKSYDKVAKTVFRQLNARHAQLCRTERLTHRHASLEERSRIWEKNENDKSKNSKSNRNKSELINNEDSNKKLSPNTRAYHLAVTDLFVEKALTFLAADAARYRMYGVLAYAVSFSIIFGGTGLSIWQGLIPGTPPTSDEVISPVYGLLPKFTKYGMIVLSAVSLWRFGKAMLDQGERLMERRHALRQGRLFVYLHEGPLTSEEM